MFMNFMYSSVISSYSLVMVGTGTALQFTSMTTPEKMQEPATAAQMAGVWLLPIFLIQARGIFNIRFY